MSNKEKARELSKKFARQYHANNWPEWSDDEAFHYSNEEINNACLEMANWKDEQLKETLKKKMDFFYPPIDDYNEGKLAVLKDLYQELFNEYYE